VATRKISGQRGDDNQPRGALNTSEPPARVAARVGSEGLREAGAVAGADGPAPKTLGIAHAGPQIGVTASTCRPRARPSVTVTLPVVQPEVCGVGRVEVATSGGRAGRVAEDRVIVRALPAR